MEKKLLTTVILISFKKRIVDHFDLIFLAKTLAEYF